MIRRKIETNSRRSFEFVLVLWKIPAMHAFRSTYYAVKDKVVKVYGLLRMLVMKHNNNKNDITCKNLTKYKPTNEQ